VFSFDDTVFILLALIIYSNIYKRSRLFPSLFPQSMPVVSQRGVSTSNLEVDLQVPIGIVKGGADIQDIMPGEIHALGGSSCKYCTNCITSSTSSSGSCSSKETILCTSKDNNNDFINDKAFSLYEQAREIFQQQHEVESETRESLASNLAAAALIRSKLAGTKKRKIASDDGNTLGEESERGLLEFGIKPISGSPSDIGISFLGTGSAAPSKTRNNSAILLSVPRPKDGETYIVLDCGEGCAAQLYYLCAGNTEEFRGILLNISLIWISHHHADHHCGLPMLLQQIRSAMKVSATAVHRKVLVIASEEVIRYQEYCACVSGLDDIVEFMNISQTAASPLGKFIPRSRWEKEKEEATQLVQRATSGCVRDLTSISVYHCRNAFGVRLSIQVNDSRKGFIDVVYR